MSDPAPSPIVQSAERLCGVLDRVGDALVSLDLTALLATEQALAELLNAMPSARANPPEDAPCLAHLVSRARASLLRCRRLGGSLSSVARDRLQVVAEGGAYDRGGDYVEALRAVLRTKA